MAYSRRGTIHTPNVRFTQMPEGKHGLVFSWYRSRASSVRLTQIPGGEPDFHLFMVPFTRRRRAFDPDTRGRRYISIMLPA